MIFSEERLASMSLAEKREALGLLEERAKRRANRNYSWYFPDEGPFRRDLYHKHTAFFEAGATFKVRAAICANRIGKTESLLGYESVLHATGDYPKWWKGRKFNHPVLIWACGDTGKTLREIMQVKYLGLPGKEGSGLIPKASIVKTWARSGVPDAVEMIDVMHISGTPSRIILKSYDQGLEAFFGTAPHVICEDEEVPANIHYENITRIMTSDGIILVGFTPLKGLSDTVQIFEPDGVIVEGPSKDGKQYLACITWDDVPHLSKELTDDMLSRFPPHLRDAKSKGIPSLGAGAIYPVEEEKYLVDDFPIPKHWKRIFGFDVGWNCTAAAWLCIDPETAVTYMYSEHKQGEERPSTHAEALRARGDWIPGEIDPASRGRSQADGKRLIDQYRDLGIKLAEANNAVEAGIYAVWEGLTSGQFKIFKSCNETRKEIRVYRRDEKGRIVKSNDHVMDAMRYAYMGKEHAVVNAPKPVASVFRQAVHGAGAIFAGSKR